MGKSTVELAPNFSLSAWRLFPLWLTGPRVFRFFWIGVLFAALFGDWAAAYVDATRQDSIRYSGWLLDLMGLATIAYGISQKLDVFQETSIWGNTSQGLFNWLKSFPFISRHYTIFAEPAHVKLDGFQANVQGTVGLPEDVDLDGKVKFLLERYEALNRQLSELRAEIKGNTTELTSEITKLSKELRKSLGDLSSQTEKLHVGDVGWEFIGLFWILLGITFATVPELVEWAFGGWLIRWFEVFGTWFADFI